MNPEMDLPDPSFHRRARLASWRRLPPLWQTKPWTDQTKIVNTCNLPNLVPLVIIWKTVDRISDIWRHWAFSFAWQNRYIVFHSKTGLVQTLANYSTRLTSLATLLEISCFCLRSRNFYFSAPSQIFGHYLGLNSGLYYDLTIIRLRYQSFGIRLEVKPWVGTPIRLDLVWYSDSIWKLDFFICVLVCIQVMSKYRTM